jgi:methyl coenzyme M reductase gamma subunit
MIEERKLNTVRYFDENGLFLFEEPVILNRPLKIGDDIIENRVLYRVLAVAVRDDVQEVTLRRLSK